MKAFKLKSAIIKYKSQIIHSSIISIFLIIAGYFANNMSLFTGENLKAYYIMEVLKEIIGISDSYDDDVKYIDTAYDKELITYAKTLDENADTLGNTEITNRKALYSLLLFLKDVDYKYLILDTKLFKEYQSNDYVIDQETGDSVKVDYLLVETINKMKRVAIVKDLGKELIDDSLEGKAALAQYNTTATFTSFVRYKYLGSIPSIPLAVYNNLNKESGRDTIKCHIPFNSKLLKPFTVYTQGNKLCYNSLFLAFNIQKETKINDYAQIMGRDILDDIATDPYSIEDKREIYNGKYIIIGNFETDKHDTYTGKQDGPVILYKAIKALNDNKHIVRPITLILLFLLYFSITFLILIRKSFFDFLPIIKKSNNGVIHYIVDLLTFSSVLFIYHFIEYMTNSVSFSFVIPIIIFTALRTYVIIKNEYKMKRSFLLILVALLAGLFVSFKPQNQEDKFKVTFSSSSSILIDEKPAYKGQIFTMSSSIKFSNETNYIRAIAMQNTKYLNDRGKECSWNKGDSRIIRPIGNNKKLFSRGTWLKAVITASKGGNDKQIDTIIIDGECTAYEIENKVEDLNNQYYRLEILDGKYKGKTILARNDDSDPVIWFFKDNLKGIINVNENQSFKCRMDYISQGDTINYAIINFIYKK